MNQQLFLAVKYVGLIVLCLGLTCCKEDKGADIKGMKESSVTLMMATSADQPPYEFYEMQNGENKIIGFDMELAEKLAKMLDIKIEIVDMDFNGLIAALQSGRADFVIAGMTLTEDRAQNADFSIPYHRSPAAIVFKHDGMALNISNMGGKKVGVQLGTVHEDAIKKITRPLPAEVTHFNKLNELIQEVRAGRLDGVVMDIQPAAAYVAENQDLKSHILKGVDTELAVAFPKGSRWVEKFNEVLRILEKSGELAALKEKWKIN